MRSPASIVAAFTLIGALTACGASGANSPLQNSQDHPNAGGSTTIQVVQQNVPSPFVEISIPTSASQPAGIATRSNGQLWFTESNGNKIASISNGAVITEFALPTSASAPQGITIDAATGDAWFTERQASKIGHLHVGSITEYSIPTSNSGPYGITKGPDGNFWFTEYNAGKVANITPSGSKVTEFALDKKAANQHPTSIVTGPDGALWFAESNNSAIGRATTKGAIGKFGVAHNPQDLAVASDGNFYFTMPSADQIGRLTSSGSASAFTATSGAVPFGITKGPDGRPWFTETGANAIQTLTSLVPVTFGTQLTIPTSSAGAVAIATGADGNLWFTEQNANKIGVYLYLHQTATPSSIAFTALTQMQRFSVSETHYGGTFFAKSSNSACATVSPASGATSFTATAIGVGTCAITVSDNQSYPTLGNGTTITVTVTTTTLNIY